MELNYFDLIVGGIILLLGLKGILNGLVKELFGLLGIVGGVFVASRFANKVGMYISDNLFHFNNESAINFTGFLVALAAFWAAMIVIGFVFKKLVSVSGLGIVDKIFGFIFGAGKFFFIVSIIIFALNNMKSLQDKLHSVMHNSILFPIMVETGGFIMKLDPTDHIQELQEKAQDVQENLQETLKEHVQEAVTHSVEEAKDEITHQVEDATQQLQDQAQEQLDTAHEAVTHTVDETQEELH